MRADSQRPAGIFSPRRPVAADVPIGGAKDPGPRDSAQGPGARLPPRPRLSKIFPDPRGDDNFRGPAGSADSLPRQIAANKPVGDPTKPARLLTGRRRGARRRLALAGGATAVGRTGRLQEAASRIVASVARATADGSGRHPADGDAPRAAIRERLLPLESGCAESSPRGGTPGWPPASGRTTSTALGTLILSRR